MRLLVVVLATVALAACKKPEPPARPQAAQAAAPAPSAQVMTGKVLEKLDAPPYTYLKLQTASGEAWAAVPTTDAAVGADVGVANAFPMQDFESKTLNRKFPVVYFGTLAGAGGAHGPGDGHDHKPGDGHDHGPAAGAPGAQAAAPQMPPGMGMMGAPNDPKAMAAQHASASKGPTDVKVEKVAKATGADARTVSEIWAQKAQLKEKSVTIRGTVVKVNSGIMGRNWVHLRDGSGSEAKADHNIIVTTQDEPKVGDVVVAKGTVRVDKDFGAGYAYPVIVEEGKITK
jgi:hypothetical protein